MSAAALEAAVFAAAAATGAVVAEAKAVAPPPLAGCNLPPAAAGAAAAIGGSLRCPRCHCHAPSALTPITASAAATSGFFERLRGACCATTRPSRFAKMRESLFAAPGAVSESKLGRPLELELSGVLIQYLVRTLFNSPR
jgi:hypothetical protein